MEEKYKEEEDGVQRTKREMMEEKYKEKKIEYKGQKGRTYGTKRKQMDKVEQRARSKKLRSPLLRTQS